MQYHRDGFRPGDPTIRPAAPGVPEDGTPLLDLQSVLIDEHAAKRSARRG